MQINLVQEPVARLTAATVIVYSFEASPASSGTVEQLPEETKTLLAELEHSGELTGKSFECTLLHHPSGLAAPRLLVVGAGKKDKFNDTQLRRLAGTGVRYLRSRGLREISWVLEAKDSKKIDCQAVQTIVEGAILGDYDGDRYRTDRTPKSIDRLDLITLAKIDDNARTAIDRARIIAESQNYTRELVNEPSNIMTPTLLAQRASSLAAEFDLDTIVLEPEEIRGLKMGALWAVAQGSDEPARLIVVRYSPANALDMPLLCLIGKGITFDSGGISLKPAENMQEMKTDMAGGATMLGVMRAIAQLKPRARVMAVIPATENMPSGKAFKPGDVITTMSGKTIEIINTDAEGRLVLADAITYAKQHGASVLIDAATLTGAVMVALGTITTGVFGNNKEWIHKVLASAAAVGDRMWELPLDEDYRELYKSTIADMANTGGRYGGAITGAMIIGEFAGDTPWVHLDIAGTRWSSEEKPYLAKGPTGNPVRTLVHVLTNLKWADTRPQGR